MNLAFAIATVIIGCGINNIFVELIIRYGCDLAAQNAVTSISPKRNPDADPSAGALLTLLQFVTLAIMSSPKVVAGWMVGESIAFRAHAHSLRRRARSSLSH